MGIDPEKINFGEIEPEEKSEGGNMKKDLRANGSSYNGKENTESINKTETISAPTMPASSPGGLNQVVISSLQKPTELLSEAWQLYKSRWKTFLGIVVAPMLLMFFAGVIFAIGLWGSGMMDKLSPEAFFSDNIIVLFIFSILFFIFFILMIIIQVWSQAALIYAIKERGEIGIKEAYQKSKSKIKPFFWVSLLVGFITMGGFIFFAIPGFIFAIWFSFAVYIVIVEDLKGMDAILKSREYVRNYWWPVFWRFLFINIVMVGIMIVVSIGSILISILGDLISIALTPLIMIYMFLIYNNLKEIKGDFEFRPSQGLKKKFIAIGILGFIIMPLLLSSVVLVSLNDARDKATDVTRRSDMAQVKVSLIIYYDEQGEYPKLLNELSDIEYTDPKTKEPYEYRQLDNGDDYEICAVFEEDGRKCFSSEDSVYETPDRYNYKYDYDDINDTEEETPIDNVTIRDSQRKLDLKLISTMVENYKMKTGSYPLSRATAKLSEDNSVVHEIKIYNDAEIPIDPNDPEYYYGYQSLDGETFELTARLENIDDSECDLKIKEDSGICIYKYL